MDKQPSGNFVAFANRAKTNKDKRPNFDGRIAIPGTEREFRVALWASQDKNGNVMFSGRSADISTSDSALEQIEAMAGVGSDAKTMEEGGLKLAPGQLVVFGNGFKEAGDKRPDFYGRWNPGTGEELVSIGIWARKNRAGQTYLSGRTQYKLKGMETAEMGADDERSSRGSSNELNAPFSR